MHKCLSCGNTASFTDDKVTPYDPPSAEHPDGRWLLPITTKVCVQCKSTAADLGVIEERHAEARKMAAMKAKDKDIDYSPKPIGRVNANRGCPQNGAVFWLYTHDRKHVTGFAGGTVLTLHRDNLKSLESV